MIATVFSLAALAFLATGGLALMGRLFGGAPKTAACGDISDLVFEIQPRA